MEDLRKFHYDLIGLLVLAKFEEEYPIDVNLCTASDIEQRREKAVSMYLNDPIFHAKVQTLACLIIDLLHRHEVK